jgi:glucose-1-phosphate thymidylyltransferase
MTKGIILAGGKGSRLNPLTLGVTKQLLPLYNKPVIYYPLSILMMLGIKDILIITNLEDKDSFYRLLGNGDNWGIKISYLTQVNPNGIPEAFIIGENFIKDDNVCLILGDNIFFGHGLVDRLRDGLYTENGARCFAYEISDPSRYGVIEFNNAGDIISIEEKPKIPKSNFAIPGIYFFDNRASSFSKKLKPSNRGELEIIDLLKIYLDEKTLKVSKIGRGTAWLDVGTYDSLLQAGNFIETIEDRQGMMIACLEEIALNYGFIYKNQLKKRMENMPDNQYKEYLKKILNGNNRQTKG